jgi:hypothetical protein
VADRIETPTVTILSGATPAAPQNTSLALRDAVLERVEVVIPPGPSGLVGFAFVHSGQQVIPFTEGDWIIADDYTFAADLEHFPTGDLWSIRGYNLDIYDHSLYFRFFFRELPTPIPSAGAPIAVVPIGEPAHNA